MASYQTPGVYVEEISTLPPSVAEVSTAVPAFIGLTQKTNYDSGVATPVRINNLLEFTEQFGGKQNATYTVDDTDEVLTIQTTNLPGSLLAYHVDLYFRNGGGACYICSIGSFEPDPAEEAGYIAGLDALLQEDEPTIYAFPDATSLAAAEYYAIAQRALADCNKLGDRFVIYDVPEADPANDAKNFRNGIGTNYLRYGAAYTPYLTSSLSYNYDEDDVSVTITRSTPSTTDPAGDYAFSVGDIDITYKGTSSVLPTVIVNKVDATLEKNEFSVLGSTLTIKKKSGATAEDLQADWNAHDEQNGFTLTIAAGATLPGPGETAATAADFTASSGPETGSLESFRGRPSHATISALLGSQRVVVPPSAIMAGVYCAVDRDRGVWKAPANVSLSSVIGPTRKISNDEQDGLNVDAQAGKSINAIRSFAGKGTIVWGARTMAGNDNEWRYISVRRLFNTVEESTQKATQFAVFEPNDATTWLKVKGLIDSYLFGLFEQGALAGSQPDADYFLRVGLGSTMTTQDVLEGRMIVEIGLAAVRPAEFIILRFSHKLQEA